MEHSVTVALPDWFLGTMKAPVVPKSCSSKVCSAEPMWDAAGGRFEISNGPNSPIRFGSRIIPQGRRANYQQSEKSSPKHRLVAL
jgi:hypothetical protein